MGDNTTYTLIAAEYQCKSKLCSTTTFRATTPESLKLLPDCVESDFPFFSLPSSQYYTKTLHSIIMKLVPRMGFDATEQYINSNHQEEYFRLQTLYYQLGLKTQSLNGRTTIPLFDDKFTSKTGYRGHTITAQTIKALFLTCFEKDVEAHVDRYLTNVKARIVSADHTFRTAKLIILDDAKALWLACNEYGQALSWVRRL